jgi:hypothetical protein
LKGEGPGGSGPSPGDLGRSNAEGIGPVHRVALPESGADRLEVLADLFGAFAEDARAIRQRLGEVGFDGASLEEAMTAYGRWLRGRLDQALEGSCDG